jgi:hypothetical protein
MTMWGAGENHKDRDGCRMPVAVVAVANATRATEHAPPPGEASPWEDRELSEAEADLIRPETLELQQRPVEALEIVAVNLADSLYRA